MKKLFVYGFVVLATLFLAAAGFCATTGNPNDIQTPHGPGLLNMEASGMGYLKLGGDVEFVFSKDIKGGSGAADAEMQGNWYLGKISYNIANRLDVFCVLGASELELTWTQGPEVKIDGDTAFAWGIGGKLFVYEFPDWGIRLHVNGLYRATDPDVHSAHVAGSDVTSGATDKKFEVGEWQIGGTISKEFKVSDSPEVVLVPYFGVRYSDSDVKGKFTYGTTEYTVGSAENDTKVGIEVGGDLLIGNNFSINVEGRFIDETALSLGATIRL